MSRGMAPVVDLETEDGQPYTACKGCGKLAIDLPPYGSGGPGLS
jgi:hypothetical protein